MVRSAALLCAVSLLEAVAGIALDNDSIKTAVALWLSDSTAAEAAYGHISTWETGGVTDMSRLFSSAYDPAAASFNEDIGAWDTSGVTTMQFMFYEASSFNQDISSWAVHSVTSMYGMFHFASAFDQDLGWCVEDDVGLGWAFSTSGCASTSCGVKRVADGCTPPTPGAVGSNGAVGSDGATTRSVALVTILLGAAFSS